MKYSIICSIGFSAPLIRSWRHLESFITLEHEIKCAQSKGCAPIAIELDTGDYLSIDQVYLLANYEQWNDLGREAGSYLSDYDQNIALEVARYIGWDLIAGRC